MVDSKETEAQLKNKINKLEIKLDKLKEKRVIKELSKYVGKYFKFQDCYSDKDCWYEYLRILNLNKDYNLECLRFCKDTYNTHYIQKNYVSMSYSVLRANWIEITEQEFTVEWKKMLSEINSYYK